MITYNNRTSFQSKWPWWRFIFTILNLVALSLSGILSWHYLAGGSMAGCSGGSSCDQVLSSQWSELAGVLPVSGLAMGAYLAILVTGFFISQDTEISVRRMAWGAILVLSGAIAGSAIWFTILQKWIIHHFCIYCMTTHSTGFLLALIVVWRAFRETYTPSEVRKPEKPVISNKRIFRPLQIVGMLFVGLFLAGLLATFQLKFTPGSVYSDGRSEDIMPVIDYKSVPMVGSPDAPYIVNLLFDYQCPHCQKLHFMLDETITRYNGKIAFVLCPTPLNNECNPYVSGNVEAFKNSCGLAQVGLAVFTANREAFSEFENWMFSFESGDRWQPRTLETARSKAIGLIGQASFEKALSDSWIGQYMQTCIRIYGQTVMNGQGGVPKLVFGSRWVIPEPSSVEDFITILQNSLGVPKP
jgi:uncharacterized membrane protein/protein-disulfide isomerase